MKSLFLPFLTFWFHETSMAKASCLCLDFSKIAASAIFGDSSCLHYIVIKLDLFEEVFKDLELSLSSLSLTDFKALTY